MTAGTHTDTADTQPQGQAGQVCLSQVRRVKYTSISEHM